MLSQISSFLNSGANIIWFMIVLPAVFGVAARFSGKRYAARLMISVLSAAVNLLFALSLYLSESFYVVIPFASHGLDIALNVNEYSAMFLAFAAAGFLVVSLYSVEFLKGESCAGLFMLYLNISIAMINGALLSDNLGIMLFFWEGLLCTLFGMLLINNRQNPKAAVKALVLSGTADLLLMLGIIITVYQAGTPYVSQMQKLPVTGIAGIGFVCMMLGAVGKAGSLPFHTWIPEAAGDAPTPFLAAFPGMLEKFLGICLAVRIVTDIYDLRPGSGMSIAVMALGTLTIIVGVAMALIQKDMKRLLAYHAISQVGYMVLGIGTALPVGIIGGIFHMLNNTAYKSCLFMTAGSIERQTGTTDLRKIGGLAKHMPVTAACFIVSGLAIAGVPPFSGFFSKELVFDAALESNVVFYAGALLGAFMTAVSFLKMGRAAFAGELKLPENEKYGQEPGIKRAQEPNSRLVRESGFGMLLPMCALAVPSILFGVANTWPLDSLISPALEYTESYSGWPHSAVLVLISLVVLALAVCDHIYGSRKSGSAINAADHIHYAPVLRNIYAAAEKGWFDPYNWTMRIVGAWSALCMFIERGVAWFYDVAAVGAAKGAGNLLHRIDNGSLSLYLAAAVAGVGIIVVIFLAV